MASREAHDTGRTTIGHRPARVDCRFASLRQRALPLSAAALAADRLTADVAGWAVLADGCCHPSASPIRASVDLALVHHGLVADHGRAPAPDDRS